MSSKRCSSSKAMFSNERSALKKLKKEGPEEEFQESPETKVVKTGCIYFLKGCCARGTSCPYAHVDKQKDEEEARRRQRDLLRAQGRGRWIFYKSEEDEAKKDQELASVGGLMSTLPLELIILIFCYLEHHEVATIASVCKQWAQWASDQLLWKRAYEKMWETNLGSCAEENQNEQHTKKGESTIQRPQQRQDPNATVDSANVSQESIRRERKNSLYDCNWKDEYKSRLELENRGWKAKNVHRLSKKVTNVETYHNATFITSLNVNRPDGTSPNKMTKVKASCFVLVVDRTTSSLHRKNDLLAIAPNWELDHGVVRIIEMKSYKKKKTIIIRPEGITSPLIARFSNSYADNRMAIAGEMQPGVIEVWDWPNNLKLQEYRNSSLATCLDFSGQDLLMGEGCGKIQLFDLRKGADPMNYFQGHKDRILCMQRRDNILASGSSDGTVRIWDLRKPSQATHLLQGHSISFVPSLQFDSQKLIFAAVHQPPSSPWRNTKNPHKNPFRYQMLHAWNSRTFEFWNSLDFSKECVDATSPLSFDFSGNFLVVGVPRQVVMLNFYNNSVD